MLKNTDWLLGPLTEIPAMCRKWIAYLIDTVRIAWGIPDAEFTELEKLFTEAETLLQKAQDEAERTHVITVECQAAFKALTAKMRFFRDRYFKIPPLSDGDWAALGFRQKDPHHSPVPAPDGVPSVSLSYTGGPHAITVHLGPMLGTQELDPAGDYGYAIYAGIMPPGGATLEQAASEKHYLMKPPRAPALYAAEEGEAPVRRGRWRHDGLHSLPLREPERGSRAVGADSFGDHSVALMQT